MSASTGSLPRRVERVPPGQTHRVELALGNARVVVAAVCLATFLIYPTGASAPLGSQAGLQLGYLLYSLAVLTGLRFHHLSSKTVTWVLHALDTGWATVITLGTGGVVSPYIGLFGFALVAAAYRWGLLETLATATTAIGVLLSEFLLVTAGGRGAIGGFIIVHAAYLLVGGALLGYLMDEQKHLRAEAAAVTRVMEQLQPAAGVREAVQTALVEILALFDARTVVLAAHDRLHDSFYVWNTQGAPGVTRVSSVELPSSERRTYLFPSPAESWYAVKRRRGHRNTRLEVRGLHGGERRPHPISVNVPDAFLAAHPFRSLLVLSATFGEEWDDRLFVLDAKVGARQLRLLQTIARHVGPAIYSVDLIGRLRSRVGAAERARVARELHDGIIQSLIGLEMQVEVWRRDTAGDASVAAQRLSHIQQMLRKEVMDVRDLLQQMKPAAVDPKEILEHLAEIVERFQRHSGIAAHFVSEIDELALSPHVCSEIARIVQEALVNVRKHSGARNVLVRVSAPAGYWKFEIDDDGRGFGFAGRHSQADLQAGRKGPVVIKERVRSIGGKLEVESAPGQGARVEVWLPRSVDG